MLDVLDSKQNENVDMSNLASLVGDLKKQMYHFDTLPSTQIYAIDALKNATLKPPFCIYAAHQSNGMGSRGNRWDSVKKAILFSFAVPVANLPQDLRIESSSIFFGVIMCAFLRSLGSRTWLKYPNDLYIDGQKIGGILTQKVREAIVCGIGINLYSSSSKTHSPHIYATLEENISSNIDSMAFIAQFFESFQNFTSWKQIFSIYKLEFHKNHTFSFHFKGRKIYLKDTVLNEDGSISIDGYKIYSLR